MGQNKRILSSMLVILLGISGGYLVLAESPTSPVEGLLSSFSSSKLVRDFTRAQKAELKNRDLKNKIELKELKVAQETHRKNWEKNEKITRHQFFDEHPKGQDRRAYIQDYLKRKEQLNHDFAEEKKIRVAEQEENMKTLKQTQLTNLQKFNEMVDRGEEPPQDLWPKA